MSSAHEIVFKDVSVPAPNKSALKTKVSSSKKKKQRLAMIRLDLKKIILQWGEMLGEHCWHLQMIKLSPCETAFTFAAQSPPGTRRYTEVYLCQCPISNL